MHDNDTTSRIGAPDSVTLCGWLAADGITSPRLRLSELAGLIGKLASALSTRLGERQEWPPGVREERSTAAGLLALEAHRLSFSLTRDECDFRRAQHGADRYVPVPADWPGVEDVAGGAA